MPSPTIEATGNVIALRTAVHDDGAFLWLGLRAERDMTKTLDSTFFHGHQFKQMTSLFCEIYKAGSESLPDYYTGTHTQGSSTHKCAPYPSVVPVLQECKCKIHI